MQAEPVSYVSCQRERYFLRELQSSLLQIVTEASVNVPVNVLATIAEDTGKNESTLQLALCGLVTSGQN